MIRTTPSFWWDNIGGPSWDHRQLESDQRADIVIVGAGYTGLWTAYELLVAQPDLDVVLLDAHTAGYGASGRNGGWMSGLLDGPREEWARRCSPQAVVALQRALNATVDHIAEVCTIEQIDCDLRKDGALLVATSSPQERRLDELHASELAWGALDDDWLQLTATDIEQRIRISGATAALFNPNCARIQPAKLVRGLVEAVIAKGARLYEHSAVTEIDGHRAVTNRGTITAKWIVRATEGFTASLPGYGRRLLPMNSAMIITDVVPDSIWEQIGWTGAETFHDLCHRHSYLQRTADNRIAIGGRGRPYRYASKHDRDGAVDAPTVGELRTRLIELFPSLRDVPIQRGWCGVLGVARDWSTSIAVDHDTGHCFAGGYAGDGVTAANLAARTLRDLIVGIPSELTELPWVGHANPLWEPEPLRWLGVQSVYHLYRRIDRTETKTGRTSKLS